MIHTYKTRLQWGRACNGLCDFLGRHSPQTLTSYQRQAQRRSVRTVGFKPNAPGSARVLEVAHD